MPSPRRAASALLLAVVALLAATGCANPLVVEAAPYAADVQCASMMLGAPDAVGGLPMRATSSQATAAYGEDPAIVVRCGVEPPGPTEDSCVAIDTPTTSQDWVVTEDGVNWTAVSFGRSPALEVTIPMVRVDEALAEILTELSGIAALADSNGLACR